MKKRIRIQGLLIVIGVTALLFFYPYLFAQNRGLVPTSLGVLLVLCGYYFRIVARGLKAELNPDGKTLITQGVYALTRNPMYLGTLFIGSGLIMALFQWWVEVIFILVYLAIYLPQMDKESRILRERFQEGFNKYCQDTPKFFPGIKMIMTRSPSLYLKLKPRWLKKELPSLSLTLIFLAGFKLWAVLQ
jgi:protein-S-isoprenylcysteine O-methyltransferase Ste14